MQHRLGDDPFLADNSEQLLDDVLDGHDPGGATVFIDHDSHVGGRVLHLPK